MITTKKLLYVIVSFPLLGTPIAFSSSNDSGKESTQTIQYEQWLEPLVAKINTVCEFKGRLDFRQTKIIQENSSLSTKDIIRQIYRKIEPGKFIAVLTVKDGTLFFPYYFENITYISKNSSVTIENSCQSSFFSLHDDKIQNALGADNLGGKGWLNENTFIPNWKKEWKKGNLLLLVSYKDNLFGVLPVKSENKFINQISSNIWHSSGNKKAVSVAIFADLLIRLSSLINNPPSNQEFFESNFNGFHNQQNENSAPGKNQEEARKIEEAIKILGVGPHATKQEINQAFKKKAQETHPDKNKEENSTEKFQKVNQAHDVLLESLKKKHGSL